MKRMKSFSLSSLVFMVALLGNSLMVDDLMTYVGNISGAGPPNYLYGIRDV